MAVKETSYDARLEAEGLEALGSAGALTPRVLEVTPTRLVMEWIDGAPRWSQLGRSLAIAHRNTNDRFGWHRDNVIGPLPQHNGWHESWGTFFVERRVRAHLGDPAVPRGIAERLGRASDGPLQELLERHDPRPSLTHGDLWSGNIVAGHSFVDPAVSFADRELDLAFLAFFGGVPDVFVDAYLTEFPLPHGWEERRPALQLHHALVHVRLFGGSYVARVEAILSALGW